MINNGWIETKIRLPDKDQDVLFIAVGQIYLGIYDIIFDINNNELATFRTDTYAFESKDVKYWQPLPEMPE